jgi:hypothetical protein
LSCLCVVEFSLISSIVSYIHLQGPLVWQVSNTQYNFLLDRIPAHLHLDAGHVSNAAAGLGFFLGLFGILIAITERRNVRSLRSSIQYASLTTTSAQARKGIGFDNLSVFLITFATFAVLEFLLALSALIYSFVYEDNWSPGTWFSAVLALPLALQSDRDSVKYHISVMKASKWMLVPIFIVTFIVMVVGASTLLRIRKERTRLPDKQWVSDREKGEDYEMRAKHESKLAQWAQSN